MTVQLSLLVTICLQNDYKVPLVHTLESRINIIILRVLRVLLLEIVEVVVVVDVPSKQPMKKSYNPSQSDSSTN